MGRAAGGFDSEDEGFERADRDHDERTGRYRAPGIKPVERGGGGEGYEFGLAPSVSPVTLVPDWIHPGDRVTAFELERVRDECGEGAAAALDALTRPCPRCALNFYAPDGEQLCASCERDVLILRARVARAPGWAYAGMRVDATLLARIELWRGADAAEAVKALSRKCEECGGQFYSPDGAGRLCYTCDRLGPHATKAMLGKGGRL